MAGGAPRLGPILIMPASYLRHPPLSCFVPRLAAASRRDFQLSPRRPCSQMLKDHFRTAGDVLHADVAQSEGRSRGYGTVLFSSTRDAAKAIQLFNETIFGNRQARSDGGGGVQEVRRSGG